MEYLPAVELEAPSDANVNAAVIWLHGLGADGNDFVPIIPELRLSGDFGIRFVFPHAPAIPVTINNGFIMPAWYDIKAMDVDRNVDREQLLASARRAQDLVDREVERGISPSRIVLAGFSQGGAVAYEAALTYGETLAGLIALSTYLPTADSLEVNAAQQQLPILVAHGDRDPVVPESLGKQAVAALQGKGLATDYRSYPMEHAVCPAEIGDIASFLNQVLGANKQ
jgi:phospholipase/carboxylesterase